MGRKALFKDNRLAAIKWGRWPVFTLLLSERSARLPEIILTDILNRIDANRRRNSDGIVKSDLVREISYDESTCIVDYARFTPGEYDAIIRDEISRADARKYALEWKVYEYDVPAGFKDRLIAAGFVPEPVERLMVLPLSETAISAFNAPEFDIRRIRDPNRLDDVADISREIGQNNVVEEKQRLALTMRDHPDEMSIYVAYEAGSPVACGRMHFNENSEFAEHCGARTRTTHRKQGLYTAIVAQCLREAIHRKCEYVIVDALPTSEPILRKRGFQFVTHTQPFVYQPR